MKINSETDEKCENYQNYEKRMDMQTQKQVSVRM